MNKSPPRESNVFYKLKIFEKEHYYNSKQGQEVWYKIFYVYNKWKEYKILFNEMHVKEYWEQDYISDNQQIFTNITGICITVQNRYKNKTINGTLYVDDIELY